MKPKITIVGRQNVGKSTLFNTLTRSKKALVSNEAGITRDRLYASFLLSNVACYIIDTPGIASNMMPDLGLQIETALLDADLIYFVVDSVHGLHPLEYELKQKLCKIGKPIILIINKSDLLSEQEILSQGFYEFGITNLVSISALHKKGLDRLYKLSANMLALDTVLENPEEIITGIKCAIIGKPNVGKSTLINAFLNQKRQTVYDQPGTTTDSVEIPFIYENQQYILIDTAGIRRKNKMPNKAIDRLSTVKSLSTVEVADVILLLIDGTQSLSQQDLRLLRFCFIVKKKPVVVVVNKCDLEKSNEFKKDILQQLNTRFAILAMKTKIHFISAIQGTGIHDLLRIISQIYTETVNLPSTNKLNLFLQQCLLKKACTTKNHLPIKMKYVHIVENNPLTLAIYGNRLDEITLEYQRYLENRFCDFLKLKHSPLRIIFKSNINPYFHK